jgi:c-di-AMP phosphodiesterase-like protein
LGDAKRETPIAAPIASKSGRLCPMTITLSPSVRISLDEIDKKPELKERFVTSDEAWDMMTSKTTVVVVDTHKPEMVLDENVLLFSWLIF